ncbi:universal stress protein [Kaistella palustris]|uniref:universal stress protein n=1 Tax=Kaistella palustris TaxID=493376 RepID=UPI000405222C|nr:universal stress protein [Kaistella palustris]
MKTILLLMDFSETAKHAASYLSSIADQMGIERIVIYHSYPNPRPDMILVTDVLAPTSSGKYALYSGALHGLTRIKAQLEAGLRKGIIIDVLADDRPVLKAVEEITENQKIDLVVLGICGNDSKGVNRVGRIPANLIKRHKFPLLIVPSLATIAPVKALMLACDLKDILHRLPDAQLKSIVKSFHATLHIVHVDHGENVEEANQRSEQAALHQLLDEVEPEFHYLRNKDVIAGLFDFSDQHQIDLMMAVPKQRGFLETLFHESATRKLALKATKPLLILHRNN